MPTVDQYFAQTVSGTPKWVLPSSPPFVPPTDVTHLNTNFDSYPTGPMSIANFRTAVGDTNVGGTSTTTNTSIVTASGHGGVIRQMLPNNDVGGSSGIAAFIDDPATFGTTGYEHATIEYDIRLGTDLGGGGKMPGLGGMLPGHGNAPTGGSPSPYGWSGRGMWQGGQFDGGIPNGVWEFLGYFYAPTQVAPNYGLHRYTGVQCPTNGTTWMHFKQEYKMNSVNVEGSSGNPDGLHKIWAQPTVTWDPSLPPDFSSTNEIYRIYQNARINQMLWSIFYGGATTAWCPATPQPVDIDNLVIKEVVS